MKALFRDKSLIIQPAKDFVHKIHVKLNPELEGRFQPVDKPQHLDV